MVSFSLGLDTYQTHYKNTALGDEGLKDDSNLFCSGKLYLCPQAQAAAERSGLHRAQLVAMSHGGGSGKQR